MAGPQPTAETEIPEPPRPRRRRLPFALLGTLALVGAFWGVRTWLFSRSHETTDNAQVEGHIVPVLPKVGGYVTRVLVEDNQVVREGDTLVTLDSRDYQVRLQEADADLQAAKMAAARNGEATAQVGQASAKSGAAQAGIGSAQATYDRALHDVERMRRLAETRVISRQQLDEAEAAYRSAEADLRAAQSQARAAQAEVSGASAGVRTAQAHMAAAQAAEAAAQLQLS